MGLLRLGKRGRSHPWGVRGHVNSWPTRRHRGRVPVVLHRSSLGGGGVILLGGGAATEGGGGALGVFILQHLQRVLRRAIWVIILEQRQHSWYIHISHIHTLLM